MHNIEDDQSCIMMNKEETMDLPPGFRFHPTDEEIISHYLTPKVMNTTFTAIAVSEVDLNKCEPWDLPLKKSEKESYFFCQRDRKYPTGTRTNRATECGYWKATGKDKEIFKLGKSHRLLIGMKKTLVFYTGRAPKGEKTNWVMHEFRLDGQFSYYTLPKLSKEEWVVCRVFHKSSGIKKDPFMIQGDHESELSMRINSIVDDLLNCSSSSPPPLVDPTRPTSSSFCSDNYQSGFDEYDGEFNFFPFNRTSYDHHEAYDQKPLIYNHNPNPNPNPFWPEGQLKVEQFSSNDDQDSIDAFINNITNFSDVSSSQLQNNPNHNMGMSNDIPDMADIDCLWDV